jgi:hypothetical protein
MPMRPSLARRRDGDLGAFACGALNVALWADIFLREPQRV